MPTGTMKWYDPATGDARVVRGGHEYVTDTSEIETAARVAGAAVHFDVKRVSGVAHAVNVRLRAGTRVSPHQGRFGDLAGARYPDAAGNPPPARGRTTPPPSPEDRQPSEVARRWIELSHADGPAMWTDVYAPDAKLHVGGRSVVGRDRVMTAVYEALRRVAGREPRHVAVHGNEVEIVWDRMPGIAIGTRLRITHGEIAEQWIE